MLKTLKCLRKGHWFVDSRSMPGTKVCVRCRHRALFEGLEQKLKADPGRGLTGSHAEAGAWRRAH